ERVIGGCAFFAAEAIEERLQCLVRRDKVLLIRRDKAVVERDVIARERGHHELLLQRGNLQCDKIRCSGADVGGTCRSSGQCKRKTSNCCFARETHLYSPALA